MEQSLLSSLQKLIPISVWTGLVIVLSILLVNISNWVLTKIYGDFMESIKNLNAKMDGIVSQVNNQNITINDFKNTIDHHSEGMRDIREDIGALKKRLYHLEHGTLPKNGLVEDL